MRTMPRPLALAASLVALLVAASASAGASDAKGGRVRIDVHSEEGNGVHLTFGSGLVSGLVSAFAPISFECDDADKEPEVRRFFRELDRAGDGAKGTLEHEGDLLEARREHGRLRLKVTDEDGDVSRVTLPWILARCLFAGEETSRRELVQALEAGDLSIEVDDTEDSVSIDIR